VNVSNQPYVSKRVLKLNVGFLISDGPAHSHETEFNVPGVRVDDDLYLEYLRGPLRLSRTKEGILVQGQLNVGIDAECSRCLEPLARGMDVEIEELFAYPAQDDVEFSVGEDMVLDLGPLLRAVVLIYESRGLVCREDCQGLCPECGVNRNFETCDCVDDEIDPRLAGLKELLDRK
jgi:uncharacterized protein